jgi:hypothetical protein
MESDTGEQLSAKGFEANLVRDWNLDVEAHQHQNARAVRAGPKPSRLVHNINFSMPAGTPPEKVFKAARKLVRDEFEFRHRYAMVLHTDEPHPHVHVVVKAVSEQGERLYIRKPTLRGWRRQFAANLRELGVPANATERAVRGLSRTRKSDGIYRAAQRGASSYIRDLAQRAAADDGKGATEPGKETLLATRRAVMAGWRDVSERLRGDGYTDLAGEVKARCLVGIPRSPRLFAYNGNADDCLPCVADAWHRALCLYDLLRRCLLFPGDIFLLVFEWTQWQTKLWCASGSLRIADDLDDRSIRRACSAPRS